MSLVCTFEAFKEYCDEAEQNGIEKYGLYHWTKSTIEDPLKKSKHLKSFAFYLGNDQIYEKEYCLSPIPSLAMHATNINTIYGVPPNFDWKKVWDENK